MAHSRSVTLSLLGLLQVFLVLHEAKLRQNLLRDVSHVDRNCFLAQIDLFLNLD